MAKLYFHYSTMNAGKSTILLQASYNYIERGMQTLLVTARLDKRAGALLDLVEHRRDSGRDLGGAVTETPRYLLTGYRNRKTLFHADL